MRPSTDVVAEYQGKVRQKMDDGIIESLRLFGVPTAGELRREFARESKGKERRLGDHAQGESTEIKRKKTLGNALNLCSNVWGLLRKKAGVIKAKS